MRKFYLLSLLLSAITSMNVRAAEIPLRIDCTNIELDVPIPIRGGIPFPQGALHDIGQLKLVNTGSGAQVSCQIAVHAKWPDGSIKWVLLDTVLAPKAAKSLALHYGTGVKPAPVPAKIDLAWPKLQAMARVLRPITAASQSIRVNFETGMLSVEFHSSAAAPTFSAHAQDCEMRVNSPVNSCHY